MPEKLRRKGQGETERPICPKCQQDLKRLYVREYATHSGSFVPIGWICKKCKYTQLD